MELINLSYLVNSIVFSVIGLLVLAIGFIIMDKLTPYQLWREICERQNMALAIVVAGMTIAIGLIISGAIHG